MNSISMTLFQQTGPVFFLLGLTAASFAQSALSERDIVKEAVQNNLSLKARDLQKEESMLDGHTARAQWLPQVSILVGQSYAPLDSTSARHDDSLVWGSSKTSTSTNAGVQATQAIPGGGNISAAAGVNRAESFNHDQSGVEADPLERDPVNPGYDNSWSLEFRQPLLRNAWGNDPVQSTIYIQRLDHEQLTLEQKKGIIQLISESRRQYWDVFEKKMLLDLYEKQKNHSQQRLVADRARLAIGRATPLDTLNAALAQMKAQTAILRLEGEISLAHKKLAATLARDSLSEPIMVTDSVDVHPIASAEALLEQATGFDPQLQIFSVMHEKLVHLQRRARNELLPQIDVTASYSRNGSDTDFLGNNRAFEHNLVLSLIAEYSLPTRSRKNAIKISQLRLQENSIQNQLRRDQVRLQIEELRIAWEQELRTLDVLRKAREVARKQMEASQAGYRLGTVDRLSLADAENAYLSASIDLLRSQLTMKRTQIVLEEVTGAVLPTFGVVIR